MAPFDLDQCIEQAFKKHLLSEALLREICEKTKEVLMRESNVIHVSSPVTVVGDIHGYVQCLRRRREHGREHSTHAEVDLARIGSFTISSRRSGWEAAHQRPITSFSVSSTSRHTMLSAEFSLLTF